MQYKQTDSIHSPAYVECISCMWCVIYINNSSGRKGWNIHPQSSEHQRLFTNISIIEVKNNLNNFLENKYEKAKKVKNNLTCKVHWWLNLSRNIFENTSAKFRTAFDINFQVICMEKMISNKLGNTSYLYSYLIWKTYINSCQVYERRCFKEV